MLLFLLAFAVSAVGTLLIIRSSHSHARFSADADFGGPQKFHSLAVPRVGGIGIGFGLVAGVIALYAVDRHAEHRLATALLLCGIPAFGSGLFEDISKRVQPRYRLVATALSAVLAVFVVGGTLARTDLWGLDWIASFAIGAACLAILTVAGIAHAINIIDGFNGLASMCVVMILGALTYVANQVGDTTIATLALVGVGAVLGFFVWNFPGGLIFLGDGGAYFLGFYVAELGILLVARNPAVSPLCPLLICIYPVFETLFSMYRRKIVRGRAMGLPDGVHLHSLIYRRLLRWAVGSRDAKMLTRRNSMTAPYLWLICGLGIAPAVLWWNNSRVLGAFVVLFGFSYVLLYASILRFKIQRWLVFRARR
jgi:UDP-N-acetylmuramyl pentapeptide phosphotransferase/UDP-N-acetylglucosamine-1-phosphate transferase